MRTKTQVAFLQLITLFMTSLLGPPSHAQDFSLGTPSVVPPPESGLPIYQFCPDGHTPYLKDGNQFQMYWAGSTSYRTQGDDLFQMGAARPVLSPGVKGSFDNGGAWLYSVLRRNKNALIGFYHAEDHEFKGDPTSKFTAWKSVALTSSDDNGRTWRKIGQILTSSQQKPDMPSWGGNGDFCVVRDQKNRRWVCYYQEHFLCMAISMDAQARPGTWKKYYQGKFTEPGLGGRNSPIPTLATHAGGNPSVHFNAFLKKWVMVWHTWERSSSSPESLWISSSQNMLDWTAPRLLVKAQEEERLWYPTIIGQSDSEAGQRALLCYARFPEKSKSERQFVIRQIKFHEEQ